MQCLWELNCRFLQWNISFTQWPYSRPTVLAYTQRQNCHIFCVVLFRHKTVRRRDLRCSVLKAHAILNRGLRVCRRVGVVAARCPGARQCFWRRRRRAAADDDQDSGHRDELCGGVPRRHGRADRLLPHPHGPSETASQAAEPAAAARRTWVTSTQRRRRLFMLKAQVVA